MKNTKKTLATMTALLIICIVTSIFALPLPLASGQQNIPAGTHISTYAKINVAPNPIGVGQTVSVNFYLATPLIDSSPPVNMTVKVTDPNGQVKTMGHTLAIQPEEHTSASYQT